MSNRSATILGTCLMCGRRVVWLQHERIRFDLRQSSATVERAQLLFVGRCPECNAVNRVAVDISTSLET